MNFSHNESSNGSFELIANTLTVIAGPTGSGKTTLIKVLLGLLPKNNGEIYWNDVEIHHLVSNFSNFAVSYSPQRLWFLDAFIKENMTIGTNDFDKESLTRAILSNSKTFLERNAIHLSGGQKQRLSIARALNHKASLYILDDFK